MPKIEMKGKVGRIHPSFAHKTRFSIDSSVQIRDLVLWTNDGWRASNGKSMESSFVSILIGEDSMGRRVHR